MSNAGWIKIHRKFLDWEWYSDMTTSSVFLHLLLIANYEDQRYRGNIIRRGDVLITVAELSFTLNLSTQQIRTVLNRLKSTNEITIRTTNRNHVITLTNYDSYQDYESPDNKPDNKPVNNQTTNEQQTSVKEVKESKELKKGIIEGSRIDLSDENMVILKAKLETPESLREGFFESWWILYDKNVGQKPEALEIWNQLSDFDIEAIGNITPTYVASTPQKRFRKNPKTFLESRTWEDEIIINQEEPEKKKDIDSDFD